MGAEYNALGQVILYVLPFMEFLKGVPFIFDVNILFFNNFFKFFEEIIVASPWTNQTTYHRDIAVNYHHFRRFLQKRLIRICYIYITEKTTDIFTKPIRD